MPSEGEVNSKEPEIDLAINSLEFILQRTDISNTKTIGILICGSTKASSLSVKDL